MYRDILTNKWIIGSVVFLIILVLASVLKYQHDMDSNSRPELLTDLLIENATSKSAKQKESLDNKVNDTKQSEDDSKAAAEFASPNGFGPLPTVPPDYPDKKFGWRYYIDDPNFELIARVKLKIWREQRKYAVGVGFIHGKIYPIFKDTVYVRKKTKYGKDGEVIDTYIKEILWDSDYEPSEKQWRTPSFTMSKYLKNVIKEKNLKVINFDDAGIDPYSFLNLDKEKVNE